MLFGEAIVCNKCTSNLVHLFIWLSKFQGRLSDIKNKKERANLKLNILLLSDYGLAGKENTTKYGKIVNKDVYFHKFKVVRKIYGQLLIENRKVKIENNKIKINKRIILEHILYLYTIYMYLQIPFEIYSIHPFLVLQTFSPSK